MKFIRSYPLLLLISLLLVSMLLRVWGAGILPANGLYNVDEKTFTDSAMYLVGGQSPVILEWPAGITLLLLFLFYGLNLLFEVILLGPMLTSVAGLIDGASSILYEYVSDPWGWVRQGRILFAIISLMPVMLIWKPIRKHWKKAPIVTFSYFFFGLLSPLWIIQAWSVLPDSVVCGLWFVLIFLIVFHKAEDKPASKMWGLLFGLILSAKLTYLIFLPALLFFVFWNGKRKIRWKSGGVFIGMVILGFLLGCPFIFTDSLMLLKGFAGNFLGKFQGEGSGWGYLIQTLLPIAIPAPLLIFLPIGFIHTLRKKPFRINAFLILGFLPALWAVGNSPHTYSRYLIPLFPFLILWLSLGIGFVVQFISYKNTKLADVSLVAVALLMVILSFIHVEKDFRLLHQPSNLQACMDWIEQNLSQQSKVSATAELQHHIRPDKKAAQRIKARNLDLDRINQKRLFSLSLAQQDGSGPLVSDPLFHAISKDEEAHAIFQAELILHHIDSKYPRYDVDFHHPFSENFPIHVDPWEDAWKAFLNCEYGYFITHQPHDEKRPIAQFVERIDHPYYIYKQE